MRIRMIALATGVAMTAALVAGCTADEGPSVSDLPPAASPTTEVSPEASTPIASPSPDGDTSPAITNGPATLPLDALGAITAAEQAIPGGSVIEADRDDEDGRQVWSVLMRDTSGAGMELYIDQESGDVIREAQEGLPGEARGDLPTLTARQGIEAALGAVAGSGSVVAFDLGTEDGRVVWAVLVSAGGGQTEVYVDANTGEIVKQEADE